jgi:hypothetical protein
LHPRLDLYAYYSKMDIQILCITETRNGTPGYAKIRDEKGMRQYVPVEKGKEPILDIRCKTAVEASVKTAEIAKAKKAELLAEVQG